MVYYIKYKMNKLIQNNIKKLLTNYKYLFIYNKLNLYNLNLLNYKFIHSLIIFF